ncbi:CDGSH iron-sulfur domain-containing protein [Legionella geestiana]|uniref:CDGSH iron-sulfur domain-containing protein n=1 Tax=Legionella geestiana TaxID=45065 RepID=UPI0010923F6D|nr:CDGSH iron-sulfur domain-containing protein [Legionella geestiana]QDQ39254.1 CDGSH iron-sulfur domain-containing protein [Legionella geestiana]
MDEEYCRLRPVALEVQAGECYRWCGCGKSEAPPLCDREDCAQSLDYVAPVTETALFCGCKATNSPPLCDGSHGPLLVALMRRRLDQG